MPRGVDCPHRTVAEDIEHMPDAGNQRRHGKVNFLDIFNTVEVVHAQAENIGV